MNKSCTTCLVKKPLVGFYALPAGKYGRASKCIECIRAYDRLPESKAARKRGRSPESVERKRQACARLRVHNRAKARRVAAEWRRDNPERAKATPAAYKRKHRSRYNAHGAARYASKVQSIPAWTNQIAVEEFYAFAKIKSELTGTKWQVDHIVPIRSKLVCGLHTHYNLQVIPASDNARKGNRHWPDMPDVRM